MAAALRARLRAECSQLISDRQHPAIKFEYLLRYGLPRSPRWVIVEILPSMDILPIQSRIIGWLPDVPHATGPILAAALVL